MRIIIKMTIIIHAHYLIQLSETARRRTVMLIIHWILMIHLKGVNKLIKMIIMNC